MTADLIDQLETCAVRCTCGCIGGEVLDAVDELARLTARVAELEVALRDQDDDLAAIGCMHGFKPAVICTNLGCAERIRHRAVRAALEAGGG